MKSLLKLVRGLDSSGNFITILVTGLTFLSTILGFFRETYIAYSFGATSLTDAYYIAVLIPDLLANVLAMALTNALIPTLKAEYRNSHASGQTLLQSIFMLAILVLLLFTVLGLFFPGELVHSLAPSLPLSTAKVATSFLFIMLPSVLFTGLTGILTGVQNLHNKFIIPATMGIVFNAAYLLVVFLGKHTLDIYALSYGFLIATIVRFAMQLYPLRREIGLNWKMNVKQPSVVHVLVLLIPTIASNGLGLVNWIVDRILASGLPAGQITDLNFAAKLGLLPLNVVGLSIATTMYPRFITEITDFNVKKLAGTVASSVKATLFIGTIIGVSIVFLNIDAINVLFHHGAFSWVNTIESANAFEIYGFFIPFYLLQPLLSRLLYAFQDNKFVAVSSLCAVGTNIVLSILLVHRFSISGLVFSNGVSQVVDVLLLGSKALSHFNVRPIKVGLFTQYTRDIVGPVASYTIGVVGLGLIIHVSKNPAYSVMRLAFLVGTGLMFLLIYSAMKRDSMVGKVLLDFTSRLRDRI